MSEKQWFSFRCVFDHGISDGSDAKHTYEERIILIQSSSFHDAIEESEIEAEQYANDTDSKYLGLAQAFQMFDNPKMGMNCFL